MIYTFSSSWPSHHWSCMFNSLSYSSSSLISNERWNCPSVFFPILLFAFWIFDTRLLSPCTLSLRPTSQQENENLYSLQVDRGNGHFAAGLLSGPFFGQLEQFPAYETLSFSSSDLYTQPVSYSVKVSLGSISGSPNHSSIMSQTTVEQILYIAYCMNNFT